MFRSPFKKKQNAKKKSSKASAAAKEAASDPEQGRRNGEDEEHLPSWLKGGDDDVEKEQAGAGETTPLVRTCSVNVTEAEEDYGTAPPPAKVATESGRGEENEPAWHSEDAGVESGDRTEKDGATKDEEKGAAGAEKREDSFEDEHEPSKQGPPEKPRRSCCHLIFTFISLVTIIASACLLLTQIVPLLIDASQVSILQTALRCYVSIFCLIFIAVEFDIPIRFVRKSEILQNFIFRGFLYTFIGLIGAEESLAFQFEDALKKDGMMPDGVTSYRASLFIQISSWLMVGCGTVYLLMGICCLRRIRDRCRDDFKRKMNEYKNPNVTQ